MSESTTTEPAATTAVEPEPTTQSDSADAALGDAGKKAIKAERDRATAAEKANASLQKQLDDINAANMTDLEKAKKEAADATALATKATAEALRFRVAAKNSISDEDAELFLTGADEETLNRQAARLVERTPTAPKADLTQGGNGATGSTKDPGQAFGTFLKNQMGH